jgi:hypothetical protein
MKSDCRFKSLIKAFDQSVDLNRHCKNSLVDQSVSDKLIEFRNGGNERRMGGLKQNYEPNNLFFQTLSQATL